MSTRIVVIGNGGFAVNCLKVMQGCPDVAISLVVTDPTARAMHGLLPRFCRDANVPAIESTQINSESVVQAIRSAGPDYVFSIYNMQIIKPALLSVPRVATLNFHNGPLPSYRGVNTYSWAIINGETEFGVAWHLVDDGIDTGDIVGRKMFALSPTDTPNTLAAKGFRAGVDLLNEILPGVFTGIVKPMKQDGDLATYYSKRDLPNGGKVPFDLSFQQMERFVRGLDFRPLENAFVYPTAYFCGVPFRIQAIRYINGARAHPPGCIVDINDNAIQVQGGDGVVEIGDLLDSECKPVTTWRLQASLGMKKGNLLES